MLAEKPVAVPEFAIVAPEAIAIVEPDSAVKVFAVNWKSSAPAILISIVSSVSAVILVSASASSISSCPLTSRVPGVTRLPVSLAEVTVASEGVHIASCSPISSPKKLSPEAGAVVNVILVPDTV